MSFKYHFLDSGSFTLASDAEKYGKKHNCDPKSFYDTDFFWKYMETYARFVSRYESGIDYYANVDAIGYPDISERNLLWLQEKGLRPVPVVHYGTDPNELRKYFSGYELIGLGGLALKNDSRVAKEKWLDECFDVICNTKDRLPIVKTHGFGVTSYHFLCKYPWYSTDSTSWVQRSAHGSLTIPKKRNGIYVFNEMPLTIPVTNKSPKRYIKGQHFNTVTEGERVVLMQWLDHISVPFGKVDVFGNVLVDGVCCSRSWRCVANLVFFEKMCDTLPTYPWPFVKKRRGFLL